MLGEGLLPDGHGVTWGEDFVVEFAREHPIHSLYFDRPSLVAPYIPQLSDQTREVLEVVNNLNESVTDLQRLSARYAEFLPKQARWQAELLLLSASTAAVLSQPMKELAVVAQSMECMAA